MDSNSTPNGGMPNGAGHAVAAPLCSGDCCLGHNEFVSILADHGLDAQDARSLFDALHESDTRLILDALESVAMRLRGRGAHTRTRR
jgi:hypothetical protein